MTPLLGAALELQNFFNQRGWRFCIIGGIALLRWGEPRFTRDVDVSLLTGFGREDQEARARLSARKGSPTGSGTISSRNSRNPGLGHRRTDLTELLVLFRRAFPNQSLIVFRRNTPLEIVVVFHAKRDISTLIDKRELKGDPNV